MWALTHWQHGFAATIARQLHEAGADVGTFMSPVTVQGVTLLFRRAMDLGIAGYARERARYPSTGPVPPALQGLGQALVYLNTEAPNNCTDDPDFSSAAGACVLPPDLTGESVLAQVVLEKYLVGGSVVASVAGQALENGGFVDERRAGHFHRPAGCGRGDNNVDRRLRQREYFRARGSRNLRANRRRRPARGGAVCRKTV